MQATEIGSWLAARWAAIIAALANVSEGDWFVLAGAIIAFVGAVWIARATVRLAHVTERATRTTMQAELLEHLIERWNSTDMREQRAALAQCLTAQRRAQKALTARDTPVRPEPFALAANVKRVADFFEEMGTYFGNELIDQQVAWEIFFDSVSLYWKLCGKEFAGERRRGGDVTPYRSFERMATSVNKLYFQENPKLKGSEIFDDEEIDDFLDDEVEVIINPLSLIRGVKP